MKTRILTLLAVAGVVALACGSSSNQGATGSTIVLGAPLGLTGSLTKESALTKQGYDLWLDWINKQGGINVNGTKHPVTIKYYDDTSTANQSAVLMQKLITEDKANFLLGPYGSAATATDAAIAEQNQIPMVEANGAAQSIFNQGYKYTFGVLSPANKYLQGVLDMAATLNPKPTTIAMLSADDNFSLEVAQGIIDYAPTKGRWSKRAKGSERWVKPTAVAEISFVEWTPDGSVRHPTFRRMREDKPAKKIRRESAAKSR